MPFTLSLHMLPHPVTFPVLLQCAIHNLPSPLYYRNLSDSCVVAVFRSRAPPICFHNLSGSQCCCSVSITLSPCPAIYYGNLSGFSVVAVCRSHSLLPTPIYYKSCSHYPPIMYKIVPDSGSCCSVPFTLSPHIVQKPVRFPALLQRSVHTVPPYCIQTCQVPSIVAAFCSHSPPHIV